MTDMLTAPHPGLDIEQPVERGGHAQLTNMRLALSTLMAAQDAGEGSTRFCLLHGPSGYGKSVGAAYVAGLTNAAYVQARSVWTTRSMLEAIAAELGITKPARTAPALLDQIVDRLNVDPAPLIVDEFDYLVTKRSVNVIRDIHDATRVPIMLIGHETLPASLKPWEQFDNRIIAATPAQACTDEDARVLRDHYCLRVHVANDLVAAINERCRGVTRRVVTNLRQVQREAMNEGRDEASLGWWGGRPMLTGDLPSRRKAA